MHRQRSSLSIAGFFACSAVILAASAHAGRAEESTSDERLAGFDAWVAAVMAEWKVPGLGIAVIEDGNVLLARGYGHRNVEEDLPVTADTLFAIGSNSKSFTVTLMGMLNDEGKLDWDQPVREYLPDFRLHDPIASSKMTPRDLVTHTSGLPRHDLLWYGSGRSRKELFARLRHLEPTASFRATYQYQNLMFMTAGYLTGQIADSSWESLISRRIFKPLGMERSNLSVTDSQNDENHALPYSWYDEEVVAIPFRNIDAIGPAGSINSSPHEMIRYIQFHIDHGKHGATQLLSKKNAFQMQQRQFVTTDRTAESSANGTDIYNGTYGLGLSTYSYRGHKFVGHGGGIDGFISAMSWLPHEANRRHRTYQLLRGREPGAHHRPRAACSTIYSVLSLSIGTPAYARTSKSLVRPKTRRAKRPPPNATKARPRRTRSTPTRARINMRRTAMPWFL